MDRDGAYLLALTSLRGEVRTLKTDRERAL